MTEPPSRPWSKSLYRLCRTISVRRVSSDSHRRPLQISWGENYDIDQLQAIVPKLDASIAQHGVPDVVKSDYGLSFKSHDFEHVSIYPGFKHREITLRWPQAKGGVERCMPMLMETVQTAQVEGKVWRQVNYIFVQKWRSHITQHQWRQPSWSSVWKKIEDQVPRGHRPSRVVTARCQIRQQKLNMKAKMKSYIDSRRHVSEKDMQVEDIALVLQKRKSKFTSRYARIPLQVTTRKGSMLQKRLLVKSLSTFLS